MSQSSAYQSQDHVQHQYQDDNGPNDQRPQQEDSVDPGSPTESDSTSGCSSAAGSNSDRDASPRHRAAVDQPCSIPPSTPAAADNGSACCGCAAGDREGSMRPGDRSVSRGVGYCCTVQPLDRPVTPTLPSSTTQQAAAWLSAEARDTCQDELLLNAPRLVTSPRPYPPPLPPPRRTSLKRDTNHQT